MAGVSVPGAHSTVISAPRTTSKLSRSTRNIFSRSAGSRMVGVPPPKNTESTDRSNFPPTCRAVACARVMVGAHPIHVSRIQRPRDHARGEVAVAALALAKRHRNVDPQGHPALLSVTARPNRPEFLPSTGRILKRVLGETLPPRVVITGMGVVSPNGIGKQAFSQAVLEGKSGVKLISRWDPSSLPVQHRRRNPRI